MAGYSLTKCIAAISSGFFLVLGLGQGASAKASLDLGGSPAQARADRGVQMAQNRIYRPSRVVGNRVIGNRVISNRVTANRLNLDKLKIQKNMYWA